MKFDMVRIVDKVDKNRFKASSLIIPEVICTFEKKVVMKTIIPESWMVLRALLDNKNRTALASMTQLAEKHYDNIEHDCFECGDGYMDFSFFRDTDEESTKTTNLLVEGLYKYVLNDIDKDRPLDYVYEHDYEPTEEDLQKISELLGSSIDMQSFRKATNRVNELRNAATMIKGCISKNKLENGYYFISKETISVINEECTLILQLCNWYIKEPNNCFSETSYYDSDALDRLYDIVSDKSIHITIPEELENRCNAEEIKRIQRLAFHSIVEHLRPWTFVDKYSLMSNQDNWSDVFETKIAPLRNHALSFYTFLVVLLLKQRVTYNNEEGEQKEDWYFEFTKKCIEWDAFYSGDWLQYYRTEDYNVVQNSLSQGVDFSYLEPDVIRQLIFHDSLHEVSSDAFVESLMKKNCSNIDYKTIITQLKTEDEGGYSRLNKLQQLYGFIITDSLRLRSNKDYLPSCFVDEEEAERIKEEAKRYYQEINDCESVLEKVFEKKSPSEEKVMSAILGWINNRKYAILLDKEPVSRQALEQRIGIFLEYEDAIKQYLWQVVNEEEFIQQHPLFNYQSESVLSEIDSESLEGEESDSSLDEIEEDDTETESTSDTPNPEKNEGADSERNKEREKKKKLILKFLRDDRSINKNNRITRSMSYIARMLVIEGFIKVNVSIRKKQDPTPDYQTIAQWRRGMNWSICDNLLLDKNGNPISSKKLRKCFSESRESEKIIEGIWEAQVSKY